MEELVSKYSNLKLKLAVHANFDKKRFDYAYNEAINLMITKKEPTEYVTAEYDYFKSFSLDEIV